MAVRALLHAVLALAILCAIAQPAAAGAGDDDYCNDASCCPVGEPWCAAEVSTDDNLSSCCPAAQCDSHCGCGGSVIGPSPLPVAPTWPLALLCILCYQGARAVCCVSVCACVGFARVYIYTCIACLFRPLSLELQSRAALR